MTFKRLRRSQDVVIKKIFERGKDIFSGARVILAGGTALARFYLRHRVSCDLDFFVNARFEPDVIQQRLLKTGLRLKTVEALNDPMFAAQLHGMVEVWGTTLKISFIEDIYADMFPVTIIKGIRTETIEGLYHRKLRTLTGSATPETSSTGRPVHAGRRETARDIFDIYVLSTEVKPLMDFVEEINAGGANLPVSLLMSGIKRIQWKYLMDEFDMLEREEPYKEIKLFGIKRYFDTILR